MSLVGLLNASCTTDNNESDSSTTTQGSSVETDKLLNENIQLKHQLATKDSVINYYSSMMNEIRDNLNLIQDKQKNIFKKQSNPETLSADDPSLISDIKTLGELLAQNQSKISKLKSDIKNSDMQLNEFEKMIISLSEEVQLKNMEIYQLQQELEMRDAAFSELFDAYQQKDNQVSNLTDDLNTAYYAIGTKKELVDNNVITSEGGFLGLGKTKDLKGNFNQAYFTKIDVTKVKVIPVGAQKIEIITNHPSSSYKFKGTGNVEGIEITDAKAFWSVSKYLVIVVVK
jgi:predicted HTH domain antitoxin